MATARELIEQADALMRKNRSRNDADIPVLTDRVDDPWPVVADDDVPLLLDKVETAADDEVETAADDEVGVVPASERGEASLWPGPDTVDPATHSVTGFSPDTLGSDPGESLDPIPRDDEVQIDIMSLPYDAEEPASAPAEVAKEDAVFSQTIAAAQDDVSAEGPTAGPGAAEDHALQIERRMRTDDAERWNSLAEQISMQVLQRIDLFTDTGLKVQLAEHLRPIVERAGYELVAAINEHVGRLLRTYVAEAIEREIAQWRDENR